MALYLVMSYNSGANTISLDLEIKIYYNFLEHFFTGLCQQDQQEIDGLGDRLPFRQLGPVSYPNAVNDKTEKKSGTGSFINYVDSLWGRGSQPNYHFIT